MSVATARRVPKAAGRDRRQSPLRRSHSVFMQPRAPTAVDLGRPPTPSAAKRSAGRVVVWCPLTGGPASFNGNLAGTWPLNLVGRDRRIAAAGRVGVADTSPPRRPHSDQPTTALHHRLIPTALGDDPHDRQGYALPGRIGRLRLVDIPLFASGLVP